MNDQYYNHIDIFFNMIEIIDQHGDKEKDISLLQIYIIEIIQCIWIFSFYSTKFYLLF